MDLNLKLDELGNILLMIYFGTLGFIPMLMPSTGGALTVQGQIDMVHGVNHYILVAIWIGIFYYVGKDRFRLRLDFRSAQIAIAYTLFGCLSVLWSTQVSSSISYGTSLSISTMYAIFLISKFKPERLLLMLSWLFMLLGLATAFFALFIPSYGLDHSAHFGAWQGIFSQKNTMGFVMNYGVCVGLSLMPRTMPQRIWKYAVLFICMGEAGLSQSRDAWVACAVIVSVHLFMNYYTRFRLPSRGPALLLAVVLTVVVAVLVEENWVFLLGLMGRDPTLTGRTEIWHAVLEKCRMHPLLGYGLGAFWGTPAAFSVVQTLHWNATSAHNGFLECLVELGALGLGMLIATMLCVVWYLIKVFTRVKDFRMVRVWVLTTTAIVFMNFTGNITGIMNNISWLLLIMAGCRMEEAVRAAGVKVRQPILARPSFIMGTPAVDRV